MATEAATGRTEPLNSVADAFRNLRADAMTELANAAQGIVPKEPSTVGAAETQAEAGAEAGAETVLSHEEALSTAATPGETETEAAQETEGAEHLGLPPEVQQSIDRRIGKEVAKRKAIEDERNTLQARLTELEARAGEREQQPAEKPVQVVPDASQPLAHVQTPEQLAGERTKAKEASGQAKTLLRSLVEAPERVERALKAAKISLTDQEGNEDYSEVRMRQFLEDIKDRADDVLQEQIPAREQFLRAVSVSRAEAEQLMPELKDGKSERAQMSQQILAGFPALRNVPNWPLAVMVHVLGVEALKKLSQPAAGARTPAAAVKRLPPKLPTTLAAPATSRAGQGGGEMDEATVKRALTGDKDARQALISQLVAGLK